MVVTAYRTKTPGHIYNTDQTKWVTGSNYHGDCALNVLMNKGGRGPGKCELYTKIEADLGLLPNNVYAGLSVRDVKY